MNRTERLYKMEQLLHELRVVPIGRFLAALEVSRATFKRDIEYLRERLNAPIEWDREAGGYRFVQPAASGRRHELPGLWFNATEVHALLTMQQLLKELEPGLLTPHVTPLMSRLKALLGSENLPAEEIEKRIRVIRMASRSAKVEHFEAAASAVLTRRRLRMRYRARYNDTETLRDVSPQRLVYYRGNWYLDGWCHLREDVRSFALDGIQSLEPLAEKAKSVPDKELDAVLAAGYGIYSGRKLIWAKLRFTPTAARWVAAENWHPKQKAHFEADGAYLLEIPYSDDRELLMDIMKHGAECEVLEPPALREAVMARLREASALYAKQ